MNLPLRNSRLKLPQGIIFWREVGQGPIVVFLHGSWNDGNQWLPVIERLGRTYHCLAPDLLGFGASEQPDIHYSIELQVEFLAQFLKSLRLQQVYLVGHSLGGWIAASYALKYLDQVRGLVLISPEGVKVEGVQRNWWWVRLLWERPQLIKFLQRSLQFLAQFKIPGLRPKIQYLQARLQQWLDNPTSCQLLFRRHPAEIEAELLQEQLSWLKRPILVLSGEEDTPAASAMSQIYAQMCPHAELQILATGKENLPQQDPEAIAQLIRNFLKRGKP